ncbi:GGDEF domain-containing protein [Actinoplanes derwentensis]|uniref:GGDEF domain-containing protein n=1 Tax=Actinoplanes derwentensis TaxID=113562 RepID=UPI0012FE0F72|nr:GGDEF domain-containing protein [Actinoplanes derwentensis]
MALTALLCVFFLVGRGGRELPAILCWLTAATFTSGMAWYASRAVQSMAPGAPEKRFFQAFVTAALIFAVGDWIQVAETLADPLSLTAQSGTGLARTIGLGLGGIVMIGVMATYPLPYRSGRERLCFHLDLATVVTAVAAIGLYWSVTSVLAAGAVAGVVAGPVVATLVAFAVGRLYLSGAAPFRWHVGVIGPLAAVLEASARTLGPELARTGRPGPVFALSLGCHILLLFASWREYSDYRSGHVALPTAPRRPYSLVPYFALAVLYTLLIATLLTRGLDVRAWIIQIGAILCTGIVVARQLTAFIDNANLLAERDSLTRRLHTMAFTDSLTGLANRASFLSRLDETTGPVGVLLIDLDDFKPVNDRYGHAAGDAVLVQAANRLRDNLTPGDLPARLGGDEFAVLLAPRPEEGYSAVADRLVGLLGAPCPLPSGDTATVRASVGLAVGEAAQVLNVADQAMYRAKHQGKGKIETAA